MTTRSVTEKHHRVVTRDEIDQATGELILPTGTIVTPSAIELAARKGIVITFADRPAKCAETTETTDETCDPVPRVTCDIAAVIDHTNLSPGATREDIAALCREAVEYGFATVCVAPNRTAAAVTELAGSAIPVCGVAGFPMGANTTETKAAEAVQCLAAGAREIDMVAATGILRDGDWHAYRDDIAAVRRAIGPDPVLKVIIETSLLDDDNIVRAAILAAEAGACYVKTSTGVYGTARVEDVILLRRALPSTIKIKAAGGIRTAAQARALLEAGADRLGTSSSVAIMQELAGDTTTS